MASIGSSIVTAPSRGLKYGIQKYSAQEQASRSGPVKVYSMNNPAIEIEDEFYPLSLAEVKAMSFEEAKAFLEKTYGGDLRLTLTEMSSMLGVPKNVVRATLEFYSIPIKAKGEKRNKYQKDAGKEFLKKKHPDLIVSGEESEKEKEILTLDEFERICSESEETHLSFSDIFPMNFDDLSKETEASQKEYMEIILNQFPYIHTWDLNKMLGMGPGAINAYIKKLGFDLDKVNSHEGHKNDHKINTQKFLEWVDEYMGTHHSDSKNKQWKKQQEEEKKKSKKAAARSSESEDLAMDELERLCSENTVSKDKLLNEEVSTETETVEKKFTMEELERVCSEDEETSTSEEPREKKLSSAKIIGQVTFESDINDVVDFIRSMNFSGSVRITIEQI